MLPNPDARVRREPSGYLANMADHVLKWRVTGHVTGYEAHELAENAGGLNGSTEHSAQTHIH